MAAANQSAVFHHPQSMSDVAKQELEDLAKWFKTAKVQAVMPNLSHCADPDSLKKMEPLLTELGLYERVLEFPIQLSCVSNRLLYRVMDLYYADSPEEKLSR